MARPTVKVVPPELQVFQRCVPENKARYLAVWLNEHIPKDLSLAAWGAGKVAKKQASHLAKEGVRIERFFEVDPRKLAVRDRVWRCLRSRISRQRVKFSCLFWQEPARQERKSPVFSRTEITNAARTTSSLPKIRKNRFSTCDRL